jgi:hypothetical protein
MKNLDLCKSFEIIGRNSGQFHFSDFWRRTISWYLMNGRSISLGQFILLLLFDLIKPTRMSPSRQIIQSQLIRSALLTACSLPQFVLFEQKFIWLIFCVKFNHECLKSCLCVGINRYLFEAVRYLHSEFTDHFLASESQFTSWMLFDNIRDGHIKELKDLDCAWCKSSDANLSLSEKTDNIIDDATQPIIHQWYSHFFSNVIQCREFSKIR